MSSDLRFFEERLYANQPQRLGDPRSPFQRDRARIMHSAAFRRLQGKTQVMGVGEGDFHRTRLTHSIEVSQIGYGLLQVLQSQKQSLDENAQKWLPERDLIEAACLAHDLGHPPFGHKGEQALHEAMLQHGGFEGNGQTLRIITKLEKYKERGKGLYPTRRLTLGILKYPRSIKNFDLDAFSHPPKSYHEDEADVVAWALDGFSPNDTRQFIASADGKQAHHTLDCSILELADDIAYGIHDIEDIVARGLATESAVRNAVTVAFDKIDGKSLNGFNADSVARGLLADSFQRKQMISGLVNLFVSSVELSEDVSYIHPLLRFNATLPDPHKKLLKSLKGLAYELIIRKAEVQQLERRGQMIVKRLFETLQSDPKSLIPQASWEDGCIESSEKRRVCDYIAGMTDSYAERLYKRLFSPGFGSSGDEL
ncbi:anti-phage deoxyguanosine triphosphatase [Gluconobacter sp. P5E10]|uniref:anti-phage deoxyguanosine triphosphatase n=1 Tax=Gluconobacter sp. P5E10 TaxID=2762613 RepID=UPI001C0475C4|nr:anti-phage deoxyguanosine triphosphatase [Gluconobacter sp. P5E10]